MTKTLNKKLIKILETSGLMQCPTCGWWGEDDIIMDDGECVHCFNESNFAEMFS